MDRDSWHCIEVSDQDHPQEKEMQKGKMVVWGGLTNSWEKKKRERQKRKGKIYPSESRVPKKSKDWEERLLKWSTQIEENNRTGKTRDLFRKIRDTKGTFHAKMGTIKDINQKWYGPNRSKDIKKRWQEYTGEIYKKILMTQITMMVWPFT